MTPLSYISNPVGFFFFKLMVLSQSLHWVVICVRWSMLSLLFDKSQGFSWIVNEFPWYVIYWLTKIIKR